VVVFKTFYLLISPYDKISIDECCKAIYNSFHIVTVALLSSPTESNNVLLLLAALMGRFFLPACFSTSKGSAGDNLPLLSVLSWVSA